MQAKPSRANHSVSNIRGAVEILIYYTLLVILWGAWVRISHSGDGCGDSWPLCDGQFIPQAPQKKTLVELSHRLMSGAFGIYVLILFFWTRRYFRISSNRVTELDLGKARRWATASLILTVTEALLGAKLVLFGLVGTNDSPFRLFAMGLHFVNSALLVGSILCWYLALDPNIQEVKNRKSIWSAVHFPGMNYLLAFGLLLLGVSGTVAALSTTLFPSSSLSQGLAQDFQDQSHFLLRWRLLHPMLGLLISSGAAGFFFLYAKAVPENARLHRWRSYRLSFLFALAGLIGLLTLFLLSPYPLKILHLAVAHGLWIGVVSWIFGSFYEPREHDSKGPVLYFDGVCHLCHGAVVMLLRWDVRNIFRYAPLQGEWAAKNLAEEDTKALSSLVIQWNEESFRKSKAVLFAISQGPFELRLLSQFGRLIPKMISDRVYDWIAKNRYLWFGQLDSCQLPEPKNPLFLK